MYEKRQMENNQSFHKKKCSYPGTLIVFEGIDGSGKSTLTKKVFNTLASQEKNVVLTKEPGGTKLGKKLTTLLSEREDPLSYQTEFLLFAADRSHHIEHIVLPALQKGAIVISDRMTDSSIAYQSYGGGVDLHFIKHVNNFIMKGVKPTHIFYLNISLSDARQRIAKRSDKHTAFEKQSDEYWQRVIEGYKTLFSNRDDVTWLDATLSVNELCKQTLEVFEENYAHHR